MKPRIAFVVCALFLVIACSKQESKSSTAFLSPAIQSQFDEAAPTLKVSYRVPACGGDNPNCIVSPDLLGFNTLYAYEKDALWTNEVMTSIKDLRPGFVRWPGGEFTSFYHWKTPNGLDFVDYWNPLAPKTQLSEDKWMGIEDYIQLLKKTGAKPLFGVNIQSGHSFPNWVDHKLVHIPSTRHDESLRDAIDLVKRAVQEGFPGATYFIDNEQYADNANMSAAQYAAYVNEYVHHMSKFDPDLKVVVNWQNNTGGLGTILNIAGDKIDYVDFHLYWNRDAADFENWTGEEMRHQDSNGTRISYTDRIKEFRTLVNKYKNARGEHPKLGAFEWNIGPTKKALKPSQFQTALMLSEMLMQFINADLDSACFFASHFETEEDYRGLLSRDSLGTTPNHQMLSLYRSILGAQRVQVSGNPIPGVFQTAAYRAANRTLTVFLLEKKGREREITLDVGSFVNEAYNYEVWAERLQGEKGDEGSDRAEIARTPHELSKREGKFKLTLGAYSLTRVRIRRKEKIPTLPVIIVAGQSNAVGPANNGTFGHMPGDERILFSYPAIGYRFRTLDLQWDPFLAPERGGPAYRGGVEIALSRRALERLDKQRGDTNGKVGVIKFAKGNTSLAHDWLGELGNAFQAALKAKIELLKEEAAQMGQKVEVVAIYWAQGENDASVAADAKNYEKNLKSFFTSVRSTLRNIPGVLGDDAPLIVAQLRKDHPGAGRIDVRQAQLAFTEDPSHHAVLVRGDDLELEADGIHYRWWPMQLLGRRADDAVFGEP